VGRWKDFIEAAPSCTHGVQIYDDPSELADSVATYLALGLAAGAPGIVVASRDHRDLFLGRLGLEGFDTDALLAQGLLTVTDAEEVLAAIMPDGALSPARFEDVVGGTIDAIAARFPGGTIRAFGEMVDILTRRGERAAADALEELWNDLAEGRDFALLCGYQLDVFDPVVQAETIPAVCRTHSHVRPVADPTRLAHAVDRALFELLGPLDTAEIYMSVAMEVPRSAIPRGQAILMWLAAKHPAEAGNVLSRTRTHYLGGPAPAAP
jgi:hypothetical protein